MGQLIVQARLVVRITIAAGASDVFRYLTNLKYHFLWNPHLQSVSPIMVLTQGSTYQSTSLLLGIKVSGSNTATKLVADKELELTNNTGALLYRVNYRLLGDHESTRLTCTTVVSSKAKAFVFTTPVLKLLARRELQSDLRALKLAIEHQLK